MALPPVISDPVFQNLRNTLNLSRAETRKYNEYYEGWHILSQLGLAIPEELKQFTVMVNWPRVTVDAIEQRLDVTGFRMPGTDSADSALWDVWQYNNMDERAGFTHTDSLAIGRSYVCVGTNDEDSDYPLISVESPGEMIAVRDPRTHQVTAGLRMYGERDSNGVIFDNRATLYLPNVTRWLILDGGNWVDELDPDEHKLGVVPVVPFINRNRATRDITRSVLEGVTEMFDVIPIADSASRALTNAQLAQETVAVPQKYVLGMSKGDFVDESGNPLPVWASYFGSIWANSGKKSDVEVGQLPSADLSNFETMVNMYARLASGVTSLPIEYFGMNTQNPPSADGQRAGETRLIKKSERKQVSFGNSWEDVQRLVLRFQSGEWDPNARRLETLWRDAGTPTVAQVTDAVVKEYQSGLTDWETAQESLGRSPETIARMKSRRQADIDNQKILNEAAQYRVTEIAPPAPTSTN
jgi:hypothetical protein